MIDVGAFVFESPPFRVDNCHWAVSRIQKSRRKLTLEEVCPRIIFRTGFYRYCNYINIHSALRFHGMLPANLNRLCLIYPNAFKILERKIYFEKRCNSVITGDQLSLIAGVDKIAAGTL